MCGIAGIFYQHNGRTVDQGMLERMRDAMVHRGPDDAGTHIDGSAGLAHRRLSIIDLSSGHQPMHTSDGRYTIVFNGEIYNYRELRREMEQEGIAFHTHSDTEVVLNWFARHGVQKVDRLNGIFAFAVWDKLDRRLTLARDRMGVKPLYYGQNNEGLVFGSEIKALFESDLVTPRLNVAAVPEYFIFRQVAGADNLFDGVRTLLPAHVLEADTTGIRISCYWSSFDDKQLNDLSFEEAAEALDGILSAAIRAQMMSDVPLGTFCSGGIDSSLVTAMAASHASQAINTFSVGFHEAAFDETAYARIVSGKYQTQHHELKLDAQEYAALLPDLIWQNDLPLNFANSVQIYAISKLARENVTVVLTGEGADELFGGYPRYYVPRLLAPMQLLPKSLRAIFGNLLNLVPDHRAGKLRDYMLQNINDILLYNPVAGDHRLIPPRFAGQWPQRFDYRQDAIDRGWMGGLDAVSNLALLDLQTYLVSILNRQDKMSMATSIEARVPFLDNSVVAFAQTLPLVYKQTAKHRKRVLKAVARRYLPNEVVDRRKSGFGVPLAAWMRGEGILAEWVRSLQQECALTDLFRSNVINKVVEEHLNGRNDHADFLWSALNFVLWRKCFGV